jgi:hypothetical protein
MPNPLPKLLARAVSAPTPSPAALRVPNTFIPAHLASATIAPGLFVCETSSRMPSSHQPPSRHALLVCQTLPGMPMQQEWNANALCSVMCQTPSGMLTQIERQRAVLNRMRNVIEHAHLT